MARELGLQAAGSAGNRAGSSRTGRTGRWNCAGRKRDGGKCDTRVVWHAILRGGLASMVDRRRHRGPDRSATGAGRVPELARQGPRSRPRDGWKLCVLGLIFLGVAALSLSGYLPFAYIIMPPLLWAAVRFEFKGAAVTLTLLALITAVFTISGASQFVGDPESQRQKQIMLQLFLVISAFSALIVAAISRQHQQALLTLRESERSLRRPR